MKITWLRRLRRGGVPCLPTDIQKVSMTRVSMTSRYLTLRLPTEPGKPYRNPFVSDKGQLLTGRPTPPDREH